MEMRTAYKVLVQDTEQTGVLTVSKHRSQDNGKTDLREKVNKQELELFYVDK
jgi:hypothetical protein